MLSFLKTSPKIRRDERGNTGIVFAFAIVPMILLVGGAIDVGNVYTHQMRLQNAGDAAVLAANTMAEATTADRQAAALKSFQLNTAGTPILSGVTPAITVTGTTVALEAQANVPTPFLQLMQLNHMTIRANTRAGVTTTLATNPGKICLLALDPSSSDGIHIQGDNDIKYLDCWAHTNSKMGTAINANGSQATAVGKGHCAVGGSSVPHNNFSPVVKAGCQAVADPFATVSAYHPTATYTSTFTAPSIPSTCTANNLNLKKGSYTLNPGRYCGGIALQAQAKVTLNPGIYIIDNGTLLVQSGSSMSGSNVLFYFSGTNARMTLIGGGVMNLKGRTAGSTYQGFLFIAHPNANRDGASNIQGGGTMNLEGVLYMPRQRIEVSGNGHVNGSTQYFGMIAKDFYFRGNGEFFLKKHGGSANVPDIMPDMPADMTRSPYLNM